MTKSIGQKKILTSVKFEETGEYTSLSGDLINYDLNLLHGIPH
jgi:hypothetical protein